MKVSVLFLNGALTRAALRIQPPWWKRWLLGSEDSDELIIAVPALDGGVIWIRDSTGKQIRERFVLHEIDRQYTAASAALRVRDLLRTRP